MPPSRLPFYDFARLQAESQWMLYHKSPQLFDIITMNLSKLYHQAPYLASQVLKTRIIYNRLINPPITPSDQPQK